MANPASKKARSPTQNPHAAGTAAEFYQDEKGEWRWRGAPRKDTDIVQLKIRMRESLRHLIEEEAKKAARSINAEVVHRLERSFDLEGELEAAKLQAAEQELAAEVLKQANELLRKAKEERHYIETKIKEFMESQGVQGTYPTPRY